jgi:transketolase
MDVITLTALLTPCLPFLMKLGQKAAESASGKIGEDSWNTAKKIWDKLHPKLEAKEDAKIAAEQLAAKPDSEARKAVFQEELESLLEENPDLVEAIAKIMQEDSPAASGPQISQTVTNNEGQAINQMTGGKAVGRIDGHIQGGVNL